MKAGPVDQSGPVASRRPADLSSMTKPRITLMVVITAAAGYLLASDGSFDFRHLAATLLGTGLLSAGASVANQLWERASDAKMRRTSNRPLPAGRIGPVAALAFGLALLAAGLAILVLEVNWITAGLGAFTVLAYVVVYTPLKKISSLSTIVGAVPGAVPPMMGWTAVTGELSAGAWALFGILFFWQLPHFLAIAWLYRVDYERGGFPMLPVGDADGRRTARQSVLWAAALVPVSLAPSALGLAGGLYFAAAFVVGAAYLVVTLAFARAASPRTARRVVLASLIYLPAILAALAVDRVVL